MARILIAEDEETLSYLMAAAISDRGHSVDVSPDGEHALNTLQTGERYDLLITDIKMPKMDGRQLIEAVQKQKRLADLPIIIMSGYVGMAELDDLLEAGAIAFLSKPVNLTVLEEYINFAIKGRATCSTGQTEETT